MKVFHAELRRQSEAVLDVALAAAEQGRIDGEHERAAACRFDALYERLGCLAILVDVELEPHRPARRGHDVLDLRVRERGQDEQRARIAGAAYGGELAVGMRETVKRRWCHGDRHRDPLAEYGGRERALCHIDEHAVVEEDMLVRFDVAADASLVVGPRGIVVPRELGKLRLRQRFELVQIEDLHQPLSCTYWCGSTLTSTDSVSPPPPTKIVPLVGVASM